MTIDPVTSKTSTPGKSMTATQAGIKAERREYPWLHFIARSNEAGKAWVAEFHRLSPYWELSTKALKLLHRGQLEEGWGLLKEYASALQSLPDVHESVQANFCRRYHAVAAFYFYSIGDFERAHQGMRLAHDEVVKAISRSEFLILLSTTGLEFCLNEARIARKQQRWEEMWEYIERGRAMVSNRLPLCVLASGKSVFYSTLADFLRGLGPMTEDELKDASEIIDDSTRERILDRAVRSILRLPGFAIDWN